MSHYLHPNYAARSHSEDQSHQSIRSGGSRSNSRGRPQYRHHQQQIKRTNSQGEEIQSHHLANQVDLSGGSRNSHHNRIYSSGSSEGNETGLVSGTESEGEHSGSASRSSGGMVRAHRLNSRRDMRTMSKASARNYHSEDKVQMRQQQQPQQQPQHQVGTTNNVGTSYGAGLHVYPADENPRRSSSAAKPDATPALASNGTKPKKSARDLMRLQAGKANLDGTGSSTYTTSTATARSRASKTEVDKLRFHINTSRRNTATAAHSGAYTAQDQTHAGAVAVTPSPSQRRGRPDNPQERYDDYNDPEVEPLPSPESSPSSSPPRGLRGSKSEDYESGGEDRGGGGGGGGGGSKSPHMHMAAPVTPSRQVHLQKHVQRQKELGQLGEGQVKKSVYFSQDQPEQQQQQQQQQQHRMESSTSRAIHNMQPSGASLPASSQPRSQGSDISAPSRRDFTMLASSNPATALNVSRDGPHATIVKLRRQLDETLAQNERSKTALARSDAVILELRRDLREASGRLTKAEGERELLDRRATELEQDLSTSQRELHELRVTVQARSKELEMITDEVGRANQRDAVLGELQLKLDRAEAQILTADMRNKQLEEDYRRDREQWEMNLARKEDELDQCRAELGGEVSNRKDAEQFWRQSANAREERMRELESEIARLANMLRETNEREVAIQSEREADREALAEVDELRGDLDEAAKVLDDTRNALNEALDELAKVRKDKDRAECDRDFVREELDILATKLEQETGEKNQLAKERNVLREENASLRSGRGIPGINQSLATSESKVGELSRQLSSTKEEAKQLRARLSTVEAQAAGAPDKASLVRSQMEKAEVGKVKRELEASNARLESRLSRIQAERDDLKQCLDDAMNELEIADAEAKDVFEYKRRNAELDGKVRDLDALIVQRDTELNALKQQITLLEEELQSSAVTSRGNIGASSAQPFNSRAKIEHKRKASESKLRALMGQVTNSIDKRSRDSDGMGAVRSIPLDSDGDASTTDDDRSNAGLLYRGRVEELKLKLKTTEETLEITQRELEEMRRQVSTAYGVDSIARSRSMDAADAATSAGGRDLTRELNMEKARAASLQQQLSLANDAVRAREESNADLRNSLKEAVSLLKPLKEHVAQAESQKEDLRKELARSKQRINDLEKQVASRTSGPTNESPSTALRLRQKEQEVERLQKEVTDMEEALFDARLELPNAQEGLARSPPPGATSRGISDESSSSSSRPPAQASNQSTNQESDANIRIQLRRAQHDLNDKRRAEEQLKQSLERTQGQLQALTRDREELIRLRQTVQDAEQKVKSKDDEITKIREQLRQTQVCLDDLTGSNAPHDDINRLSANEAKKRLGATQFRASQLEEELAHLNEKLDTTTDAEKMLKETNVKLEADLLLMSSDLEAKKEAERTLNKSLKEAVDILKPLQGHVMTVEKEKGALLQRLKTAESRIEGLESSSTRGVPPSPPPPPGRNDDRWIRRLEQEKELLEQRVHQLERDVIDADQRTLGSTMTQDVQRLQEQLVDVQKRYENTKNMLDQSAKTNASLLQDLREMENEEDEAQEQIALLEKTLIEKDKELAAAKHIATTAMVKVDSMSVHSAMGDSQEIAKLQEDLRRAKQTNDRLVASIRQRDQQIMGSSADSANGRRSATPVASEANTDVGVYHMNELGLQQSGGQDSGVARRWRGR